MPIPWCSTQQLNILVTMGFDLSVGLNDDVGPMEDSLASRHIVKVSKQ